MNDLQLHRLDLLHTSAAAPGTLLVLPPGENKTQKVAVGDLSGVVQVFSVKRGEVVLSFKTLPSPLKVTAMALGRGARQQDKIFIAAGNTVRGVTKKGKEFFRFVTTLAGAIGQANVADAHIWAACQHVHTHFVDGADTGLFLAPDTINATELLPLPGVADWVPVLACRDNCIRILGPDCKVLYEVTTPSQPTAVRYVAEQHVPQAARHASTRELLYGCQDGRVVQLLVDANAVRQGCVIAGGGVSGGSGSRAAVTAIHCGADYSQTGCADIVIGRDDGSLEVWDVDPSGQAQLMASAQLPESITAVGGGFITNAGSPDIIVHTFTGKVIAFASHPAALVMAAAAADQAGGLRALSSFNSRASQQDLVAALNARVAREAAEVAELQARLVRERERCAATQGAVPVAALGPVVDVKHSFSLQDGTFLLSVESAAPLFALALQSSLPLNLLDTPGSVAILSTSPPEAAAGNATLATYRFQESTNRLTVKFTVAEGVLGGVTVFIIPAMPPLTCSSIQVPLLPLCLHELVRSPASLLLAGAHEGAGGRQHGAEAAGGVLEQLQIERPFSELVLQGGFSGADAHGWLASVLPGLPAHWTPDGSSSHLLFKHHEAGTLLSAVYQQGEAVLLCESITTMSILHDSLLAAATAAKQHVTVRFRLHPGALQHGCRLLWPRLEVARRLARRRKLAAALHEVQVQEGGDVSFLSDEYRALLADAESHGAASAAPGNGSSSSRGVDQQQRAAAAATATIQQQQQSCEDAALDAAIQSFICLLRGFCRFAAPGAAVQQHAASLDKLLRGGGGHASGSAGAPSLQAVVAMMARVC